VSDTTSVSVSPTVALVHGAFCDASSGSVLVERLQAKGESMPAPANLLRIDTATTREHGRASRRGCRSQIRRSMPLVGIESGFLDDPAWVLSLSEAAAKASSAGEVDLAIQLVGEAAMRFWWSDPGPYARDRLVTVARQIGVAVGDPRVVSILSICDPARYATTLIEAVSHLPADTFEPWAAPHVCTALLLTGASYESARLTAAAVARLRAQGNLWMLPQLLVVQAWTAIHTGQWTLAITASEEAIQQARDSQQTLWLASAQTARAVIAASQGEYPKAECLLAKAESLAIPRRASAVLCDIQFGRALVAIGAGRYEEALEHLGRVFDPHDPAHHPYRSACYVGDYSEAAAHAGGIHHARETFDRGDDLVLQTAGVQLSRVYALPFLAGDVAGPLFEAGLRSKITSSPFYRARLLLEYGAWLRRRRKIVQARAPIRAALEAFVALGAAPWAERSLRELRAARETRRSNPEAWTQLTDHERQVVQLAAEGLSNRQIGERLFISHRTVGAHLYHIFPKLGVASRAQLRAALTRTDTLRASIT
jgi:DNA-binding CsgD family transcriptional regulator